MSIVIRRGILSLALVGSFFSTVASHAAQVDSVAGSVDPEAAKTQVLQWIDEFREEQVLFHDADLAELRSTLADSAPEEAQLWWARTTRIRAELETPQWKQTREWFREFLRVQAMFSDQQIDDLRDRAWNAAGQESSRAFRDILSEVKGYRTQLVRGAADGKAIREYKLSALATLRKQQASQRPTVTQAASYATKHTQRRRTRIREPRYVVRRPLVTSLEVARWNVVRLFWFF